MTSNNNEKYENKSHNKRALILTLIILILMLLVVIIGYGYAKFRVTKNGTISASIAEVICNLNVTASSQNNEAVNPSCNVTVYNYRVENNTNVVTEADFDYRIEITPKTQGFVLPTYYWKNVSGTVLRTNQAMTGSFSRNDGADTHQYVVEFVNGGADNVTAEVDFNIIAVQSENTP